MTDGSLLIHGVTLLDAETLQPNGWIRLENGRITRTGVGEGWKQDRDAAQIIDGRGAWLTPGFIDIHVHGGGGAEGGGGLEALEQVVRTHEVEGTTSLVVSLVTAPVPLLENQLRMVAQAATDDTGVIGSHLEGPFLAPERRGAHNLEHLLEPSPSIIERLLDAGGGFLRQVTLAPELPGALEAISQFTRGSVRVAVGHTSATLQQASQAFDRGATLLTHAFNAMPGLGHRDPGPVGAALAQDDVMLELVADGLHVHPIAAQILLAAGPDRVVAVSDAMAAAGRGPGRYRLGGLEVDVTGDRAVLRGTDTLAGSTLTLRKAFMNLLDWGADPRRAVAAVTANPARALGIFKDYGALTPGLRGDLILFGTDWSVEGVFRAGTLVTGESAGPSGSFDIG